MITVDTEQWKENSPSAPWELAVEECLLWEEYQVRSGMRLYVQNLKPLAEPVAYRFVVEKTSPVSFMCYVSGRTSISMTDCDGVRSSIVNQAGDCTLCHLPGSRGESVTHPGEPVQSVGIAVMPEFLRTMAHGKGVLNGNSLFSSEGCLRSFVWRETSLPQVEMVGKEILDCELSGPMRQVFMEYKAMELLLCLTNMLDEKNAQLGGITSIERDSALLARNIILGALTEPPTLKALAKRVNMTHTRLSTVFQLLFGTTVFGFLREERLERARRLLLNPRQGISETAYDCGFSNPGHFTKAFSGRYGVTPSRYQAQSMRRAMRADTD